MLSTQVVIANTSFEVTKLNMYRLGRIMFPPKVEVCHLKVSSTLKANSPSNVLHRLYRKSASRVLMTPAYFCSTITWSVVSAAYRP